MIVRTIAALSGVALLASCGGGGGDAPSFEERGDAAVALLDRVGELDQSSDAAVPASGTARFTGVAVVGADGLGPEAGLTRYSARAAEIDRVMLERARHRIVVVDSSKIGRVRPARVAALTSVDAVVTDSRASAETVAALRRLGVRTTVVVMPTAAMNQGAVSA